MLNKLALSMEDTGCEGKRQPERKKKSRFIFKNLKIIEIYCENRLSAMFTPVISCNEVASTIMLLFAKARQRDRHET